MTYEAKGDRASHIYLTRARVLEGELVDLTSDDPDPEELAPAEGEPTA